MQEVDAELELVCQKTVKFHAGDKTFTLKKPSVQEQVQIPSVQERQEPVSLGDLQEQDQLSLAIRLSMEEDQDLEESQEMEEATRSRRRSMPMDSRATSAKDAIASYGTQATSFNALGLDSSAKASAEAKINPKKPIARWPLDELLPINGLQLEPSAKAKSTPKARFQHQV